MYEHLLTVVAEGNGTSKTEKRRRFSALLRSVMAKAQSKHSEKHEGIQAGTEQDAKK